MPSEISIRTRKRLWLRSGDRCAYPGCDQSLLEPISGADEVTIVGVECHIVSQKDSPRVARSESSLTAAEREKFAALVENRHGYANLVLMCARHSLVIDDPDAGFDVSKVVEIKHQHESAVARLRTPEQRRDDEAVLRQAAIVEEWEWRIGLDQWEQRYGRIFGDGHPMMLQEDLAKLADARRWIFSRVWAGADQRLQAAFENFRYVAQDLQLAFEQYPHEHLAGQGVIAIKRFYNDYAWMDQFKHDHGQLRQMYEWYANVLEDLALELARSANLVCEAVRQSIDARYRLEQGLVVLESGPYMDFMTRLHRPQYKPEDGWSPYPGLQAFLVVRAQRDEHRGSGKPPSGLSLPGEFPLG